MAHVCEFYHYTPDQVRAMRQSDAVALVNHMNKRRAEAAKAANA